MGERDTLVGLQQPDVYRATLQHIAKFRADNRQQLLHLQRGAECFLQIVELSEPGNRSQSRTLLLVVIHSGCERIGSQAGKWLQHRERLRIELRIECHDFDRADPLLFVYQRQICERRKGASYI